MTQTYADDSDLRALVESGEFQEAATCFMERHGGEILAFLVVRLQDEPASMEVFSQFTENFWRGLEGFRWRTTILSWGYTLASNAANRYLQNRSRQEACLVRLAQGPNPPRERSPTAPYLRTDVKKRLRELRQHLPTDDQTLLILRIDKDLSWNELAVIFSGEGDAMQEADKRRWAARLRQRFASVKRRLRTLAEKEGLIG